MPDSIIGVIIAVNTIAITVIVFILGFLIGNILELKTVCWQSWAVILELVNIFITRTLLATYTILVVPKTLLTDLWTPCISDSHFLTEHGVVYVVSSFLASGYL
jgi:hypothetical protein